ncbi:hypothetical protein [Flavobacterium sp.]|uniref:hypothetical protein n=1 Tax=Flavobacterium sp. TaxID=239 RepID=UPI00261F1F38|nr:hypothetical protein [Flavobacterium sp.]
MLKIDLVIDKLINEIYTKSKDYLSLIIDENARVENYFSVIFLGKLDNLKKDNLISNYKFQHLVTENKRNHIDLFITIGDKSCLIEIKHLAIANELKLKNRRNLNFYTSFSDSGKKVGIIGDIEKLEKLKTNKFCTKFSLAIITNPPSKEKINKKLEEIKKEYNNWEFNYEDRKELKIGFIISKMF